MQSTTGFRLLCCALLAILEQSAAIATELPTAAEILRIHRTNKDGLSKLHLQLVHRVETTQASCKRAQIEAAEKEKFIAAASQLKPADAVLQIEGKEIKGEEALRMLRSHVGEMQAEANRLRAETKPFQIATPIEFFMNGEDYQARRPASSNLTDDELKAWQFPEAPLSAESLLTTYRNMSIYSRSTKSTPAARWWHHSADRHAYVMQKHMGDVSSVSMPPFTEVTRHGWGRRHAFDFFFSQPAEEYRVVREETIDGHSLVVVDVSVSLGANSSIRLAYRGWLDLNRGALPIKLYYRQNSGEAPKNQFDLWQPSEIVTTQTIHELPNGAFYPSQTMCEEWHRDPEAKEPTEAEWLEVRAGKRRLPVVVVRRNTWDCSVVEIPKNFDDGFFVIPFPPGQNLFDHDAGKMIGALDPKPLVKIGQQAPPLSIAQWLDGKRRKPEDLKGQVVVLDFWGLWCGACRSSVPRLKALQDKFRDEPITFISIHTADQDSGALANQIREFKTKQDWKFVGAIDTGDMLENSVTTTSYGIRGFPTLVIIGADGKIAYVDPDLDGPDCDETDPELLAQFEQKVNGLMQQRFQAVGETWPLPEGLNEAQQAEAYLRVESAFIALQIANARKKAK